MSENVQSLSRRDFVKGAAALAVAMGGVVLTGSAQPSVALADEQCTCDVYVSKDDHGMALARGNAYLTNSNVPTNPITGPFPNSSVANNATYVENGDGTYTVTVSLVNEGFGLLTIGSSSASSEDDTTATIVSTSTVYSSNLGCDRISTIVVTLPSLDTDYVFAATERAKVFIKDSTESWPIRIKAY